MIYHKETVREDIGFRGALEEVAKNSIGIGGYFKPAVEEDRVACESDTRTIEEMIDSAMKNGSEETREKVTEITRGFKHLDNLKEEIKEQETRKLKVQKYQNCPLLYIAIGYGLIEETHFDYQVEYISIGKSELAYNLTQIIIPERKKQEHQDFVAPPQTEVVPVSAAKSQEETQRKKRAEESKFEKQIAQQALVQGEGEKQDREAGEYEGIVISKEITDEQRKELERKI